MTLATKIPVGILSAAIFGLSAFLSFILNLTAGVVIMGWFYAAAPFLFLGYLVVVVINLALALWSAWARLYALAAGIMAGLVSVPMLYVAFMVLFVLALQNSHFYFYE